MPEAIDEDSLVVDVHTHCFPADLVDLAAATGDQRWPSLHVGASGHGRIMCGDRVFRAVTQTLWDPAARLAAMDASGVDVQVLSPVPITLTTWADPRQAADFARCQNDALAACAQTAPGRFRWLGSVALQDSDLAIAELHRAIAMGMAGVEIGTEVNGRELDDPSLRPFFAAAAAAEAPVFVHPTDGAGAIRRKDAPFEFGLGMLTDTAMAAGALLFGGVLEDFPDLRIGLAHGCGSFVGAFPRLSRGATLGTGPDEFDRVIGRHAALLKHLWADTLVFDPHHLALLKQHLGADHLMLGSDFPFYPEHWGGASDVIVAAEQLGLCSPAEGLAMRGVNALRFLEGTRAEHDLGGVQRQSATTDSS